MNDDAIDVHPWHLEIPPQGAEIWGRSTGILTGFGKSRRAGMMTNIIPHFVLEGSGVFKNQYVEVEVQAGDVFCLFPGVTHDFQENEHDPWRFCWIPISGAGASDFAAAIGLSPQNPLVRLPNPSLVKQCIHDLHSYYAEAERNPYVAISKLYTLLAACTENTSTSSLADQARLLIDGTFPHPINVNDLAQALSVGRNTLLRAFRKKLGITPIQYLKRMRIKRAKTLLLDPAYTVAVVARLAGYSSEKYFLRCFRESEGMTPTQWRKR